MLTAPSQRGGARGRKTFRRFGFKRRETVLVTIIPTDAPLIADVMISSGDVGYAKPGDAVMIKVDAFPYIRHGMLKGRLRSIGADLSLLSEAGASVHRQANSLVCSTAVRSN